MAGRPFVYLAVSLSAGILLGSRLAPGLAVAVIGLLTCAGTAWLAYSLKRNALSLGLALLATVFLGATTLTLASKDYEQNPLRGLNFPGYADFTGRIYRSPSFGIGRTALFLRTEKIFSQGTERKARGNLRITVLHPSTYPSPLEVRAGDRVRVSARPLSPEGFRNFGGRGTADLRKIQRVHSQAVAKSVRLVEKQPTPGRPSLRRMISALRRACERRIEAHFSSPERTSLSKQGAVLEALLLGERGRIDGATTSVLQSSGLYHLIAISGAHIGIISFLMLTILKAVRLRRRRSCAALIIFLVFYALMVEGRASVLRATIMALTYLSGKLLWEQTRVLNTIAFSAFLLLLHNPFSLFEPGFELTYAATLSIILFYPRVAKLLSPLPWKAGKLLALSLAAQLGVLPLMASTFNRVTFSSLFLNVPAIPLVGAIMGSGFLFLALSAVCPGLAALLVPGIKFMLGAFLWISRLGGAVPVFSYRIPAPPLAVAIGYTFFLLALLLRPRFKGQRILGFSLFAVFLAVLITYPFPPTLSPALRVTFLDVGQGDSILVEFPGRKKMLVDGGGSPDSSFDIGEHVVSPFLWRRGIKKLDYLVLTHAHSDHLNGLVAVSRNFRITEFWEAFSPDKSPAYEKLKQYLSSVSSKRRVFRGFVHREGPVMVSVLHPEESSSLEKRIDNDDSLVLRLTANGISILLAADIGRDSEEAIVNGLLPVRSEVLKSPHHGSRSSSTPDFLTAVDPRVAVISAGRGGSSGVPHPDILERYKAAGLLILRTDLDGAVEVTVQTPGLHLRTAASRPGSEGQDDIL
jgi:competence protein ComEC